MWSRADKVTKDLIKRRRKQWDEYFSEMNAWGRNGCLGSVYHSRSAYRWQDDV